MIHIIREGYCQHIGLNLYRAPGGFVATWVWVNLPSHEAIQYRFRFRWHIMPRVLWSMSRSNLIDDYLMARDLSVAPRHKLIDLVAQEESMKRRMEAHALIKP